MTTRRTFLKTGSLAALAAGAAPGLWPRVTWGSTPVDAHPRAGDPRMREFATTAIDAARSAGATYADVRLTLTRTQRIILSTPPVDSEIIGVGVRALVNGSWGFVSSAVWTVDEMARLGRAAVVQARANTWAGSPPVELLPLSSADVAQGEWVMPVDRDPFTVPATEKLDYMQSILAYVARFRNAGASSSIAFTRTDKTFASTDGALCSQTLYNAFNNSAFVMSVTDPVAHRTVQQRFPMVTPTAAGYEAFDNERWFDFVPQVYDDLRLQLDAQPTDSTRGDIVLDGVAMASILSESIGAPLELDRAMGYEANAYGTSYLSPPEAVLGKPVASPLLNVSANRSDPGGAATVQWDDEGIAPQPFSLVENGVAVDYITNREQAVRMTDWYRSRNVAARSHGCAASDDATQFPIIRLPNLHMEAGRSNISFDELVSQVKNGIAIMGGGCGFDQQKRTGQGSGEIVYRIVNGKRGPALTGGVYFFRSSEFWRQLSAIGGEQTRRSLGFTTYKGQPGQQDMHTVSAVAGIVTNQIVLNMRMRRFIPTM